jgi:hypothetical protein
VAGSGPWGYLGNCLSIAQHQESTTAEEDYDAEIAAAEDAYGLDLADAILTWTTAVVGEETTFLCEEATGRKDLTVAVAGFDKTYKINLAGHAAAADNDDAADLVQFCNDAESAKSNRYYDQSSAWADFRYESYAEQATAVATLAATIDIPWAHFQADLYAAKRDW